MLVDNNACWCQEYFLETPGRDYSPSTSVDLEREGVVVVFEVVELRASKSALGVGPKAPTSEDPVPVWYPVTPGRRAWMAPSGSHWDRHVRDRHLRFLNMPLQHHHFGPREDAARWKHRTF